MLLPTPGPFGSYFVRRVTFVLTLLVLAFPALDLAGVELTVGLHPEEVTRWLTESGARILLLILLAFAANRFAASVIRNAEHEIVDRRRLQDAGAPQARCTRSAPRRGDSSRS